MAPGCSRKIRDATPFRLDSLIPGATPSVPSALAPLRCELASADDLKRLSPEGRPYYSPNQDYICMEQRAIPEYLEYYEAKEMMDAHILALSAYGHGDLDEAVKVARAALQLSPICPEAYNVLALTSATTYEEALEFYKKAEELGSQVGFCCESCHCSAFALIQLLPPSKASQ